MRTHLMSLGIAFLAMSMQLPAQEVSRAQVDEQKEKRMEWFEEAKLGIFIHWGIYAVNGVSESWSFYNNYLPYEEYMNQTKGFTASKYNPKEWLDLIQESGARYTVLTTKHHDGVALWDTKAGDLSVVKSTPAGKDLVAPFVEEVRKHGLKLGFYYSLLDWSHPDYPNKTKTETRYKDDPARWNKFVQFNFAQLAELNKTWKPDLYWFDGDWEQSAFFFSSSSVICPICGFFVALAILPQSSLSFKRRSSRRSAHSAAARRTCARSPGKTHLSTTARSRNCAAMYTRPTGLSAVPPSGPAMPVTAMPQSLPVV